MKSLLISFLSMVALLTTALAPVLMGVQAQEVGSQRSAVVLMYHRFGESAYPSTNTTVAQLEDHIRALQTGGHSVVSLADVVSAHKGDITPPPKAVAITVDDAYRSFLTVAWPRLKAAGFPVTLFVATDAVESGYSDSLTWAEVRMLQKEGVTIGAHSHTHSHLPSLSSDGVKRDLEAMATAFERSLSAVPSLYAYPHGEAGLADIDAVRDHGFQAAFGQHSGAIGRHSDRHYLPRFALNEAYGEVDRFRLVIDTVPLPVIAITPPDPILNGHPKTLTLSLGKPPANIADLTCYGPRGQLLKSVIKKDAVDVVTGSPFNPGRVRVNCTLRSDLPETQGRWHWFGWQVIAGFETEGVPVHPRYR